MTFAIFSTAPSSTWRPQANAIRAARNCTGPPRARVDGLLALVSCTRQPACNVVRRCLTSRQPDILAIAKTPALVRDGARLFGWRSSRRGTASTCGRLPQASACPSLPPQSSARVCVHEHRLPSHVTHACDPQRTRTLPRTLAHSVQRRRPQPLIWSSCCSPQTPRRHPSCVSWARS